MLCSVSWKGDALPVRRISRSVVLPCLAGPITSIFSSLKGSAFRRCARRKARTEAGPEKKSEIKICFSGCCKWHYNKTVQMDNSFPLLYIYLTGNGCLVRWADRLKQLDICANCDHMQQRSAQCHHIAYPLSASCHESSLVLVRTLIRERDLIWCWWAQYPKRAGLSAG